MTDDLQPTLRMIRVYFQIGVHQGHTAWFVAATGRFDRHKHGVDLVESFPVVELHHPALPGDIVYVKHSKFQSLRAVRPSIAPRLKCTGRFQPWKVAEIVRIKDQRLPFRLEHAPKRLPSVSGCQDVMHLCYIEIPCAHQFPDVAILGKQFFVLLEHPLPSAQCAGEFCNSCLKT